MYKAIDVAKYVVQKCIDLGHPITNVQLQQLLAYIHQDWLDEGLLVFPDYIEIEYRGSWPVRSGRLLRIRQQWFASY